MKKIGSVILYAIVGIYVAITLAGCSGADGLISITPEQYLASAKEQFETIDEKDYEERDLDEIIRILENAEKNAKKSEVIDKARMYLCLVNTLKARKQYRNALMKGEYIANRPEPFYTINTKDVKETLRTAKKWLRLTNSTFKTNKILADLNYVKGIYYTQKMLTQQARDRQESLDEAILSFRRCLGIAPDYKAEFRLFGMEQTSREVKLRLIECLAEGGMAAEAYSILNEFTFAPVIPISGANEKFDFQWNHMKGLVLACMGMFEESAEVLSKFKVVSPVDYAMVDESIWLLEGVYKRLYEITKNDRYDMEAKIAAALIKKLKGPFSKATYSDSSLLFPRLLTGDLEYNKAVMAFCDGKFQEAINITSKLDNKSVMASYNRVSARLLKLEAMMYTGQKLTDDAIEELLALAENKNLNRIQLNKIGYLLGKYVMDEDTKFDITPTNHEGQNFVKSLLGKPWALTLKHKHGAKKSEPKAKRKNYKNSLRKDSKKFEEVEKDLQDNDEESKYEPGELVAEMFANKPEDWIVSVNMYLVSLPELSIITPTRVVGREDGGYWHFKDDQLNNIRPRKNYLAIFEYDNSDSEKSTQGTLFKYGKEE